MISEIGAALSSLKTVSELVKAASSMSNYGEMLAAVNTVQEKLSSALLTNALAAEKQSQLLTEIADLRSRLARLETWEQTANNYQLTEVARGIFAYLFSPSEKSPTPRHWACTNCFQAGKLSILQEEDRVAYRCPMCKTLISPFKGGALVKVDQGYLAPPSSGA